MTRVWLSVLMVVCLAGCPVEGPVFEDNTLTRLRSVEEYEALAATAHGRSATKFILTAPGTPDEGIRYMDTGFYSLHDEWYWFRLLNGARIPGRDTVPVEGHHFATIADIYAWAKTQTTLPLDLLWVDDGRLYSPRFYDLGLSLRPKAFGLGTLIHVTASGDRPERWAFQLEFTDIPTHAELVRFFERLTLTLPKAIADQVVWVVRSPTQELVAQDIERQQLRFYDRIIRQKDLTAAGELEVYNDGLTAGRLRRIASGESFLETTPTDILVLEDVPDYLPQGAGVITAVPQTPLAHLNLLARNRGIPNAYRAGVMEDQELKDLARLRSPVVVQAAGPGKLIIKAITEAQYAVWLQSRQKAPVAVTQVDLSTMPLTYDLRTLAAADSDTLRPAIGGKATGYLGLLAGAPTATPDQLMVVTIRPYAEHVVALKARLEAMLVAPGFNEDVRVRTVTLEGQTRFSTGYPAPEDQLFLQDFLTTHPVGDVLGDFARAGGVKDTIRTMPMAPATLAAITSAIAARFGHYAVTQGLRFRSSSTAEDVEGFNGAGLYDSNTGFIDAAAQTKPSDQQQTIEWALKKTWASYWSIEAFDERALENIDHLSGNMAVVVHARFDDDKEKSNGVFLLTLQDGAVTMDLNVQAGALSVTNPTSTELPEVSRVSRAAGASSPVIERLRSSTVVAAGTQVLTDAELLETFERATQVATLWLARENEPLPAERRATTQVLDFEFRQVPVGWPALKDGAFPARIVLKQTRSLDPGIRGLSPELAAAPIPRDVLNRSRRVDVRTCQATAFTAVLVEAYTDPVSTPRMAYDVDPLTASLRLTFSQDLATLGVRAGDVVDVSHLQMGTTHPAAASGAWNVVATLRGQKVTTVRLGDGLFQLDTESGTAACTVQVLRSTPTEFLLSLL